MKKKNKFGIGLVAMLVIIGFIAYMHPEVLSQPFFGFKATNMYVQDIATQGEDIEINLIGSWFSGTDMEPYYNVWVTKDGSPVQVVFDASKSSENSKVYVLKNVQKGTYVIEGAFGWWTESAGTLYRPVNCFEDKPFRKLWFENGDWRGTYLSTDSSGTYGQTGVTVNILKDSTGSVCWSNRNKVQAMSGPQYWTDTLSVVEPEVIEEALEEKPQGLFGIAWSNIFVIIMIILLVAGLIYKHKKKK